MDDILEFIFEFIIELFGTIVEEIINSVFPEDRRNSKWKKFVVAVFSVICMAMVLILILGAAFLISDEGDKKLGRIFLGASICWFAITATSGIIIRIKNKKAEQGK